MQVLISDCSKFNETFPIAFKYNVGIEIQEFTSPDYIDNYGYLANEFREKVKTLSMCGFHGPFSELVPASRDKKIKEISLNRFQTAYELAVSVGANHFNLHTGYIPKTYTDDEWLNASVEFWTKFLEDKDDSMIFHLENVYEKDFSLTIKLFDKVNEKLGKEKLTACLDIGHANSNSSISIKEWIEGLNKRIRYVHLHNNNGILDDHWGLWKGKIDVENVLELLVKHSPDSDWMIEAKFPDLEQSVLWMKEKGFIK